MTMTATSPAPKAAYGTRKLKSSIMMALCWAAAAFGIIWLALILIALFWNGFAGLGLSVFTENTPGPNSEGGLKNAIVGSLIMTIMGDRKSVV